MTRTAAEGHGDPQEPAPDFREDPRRLPQAVAGDPTGLADVGSAPPVRLTAPPLDAVALAPETTRVGREAENLFGPTAGPQYVKPVDLDVQVDVYAPPGGLHRFFRMTIRHRENQLPVIAKNVLFLVDTSASIRQTMLDQVKAALSKAREGFNKTDRFNLMRFSEQTYSAFSDGFRPPTEENIARAVQSVHKDPGLVRTDVYGALDKVLAALPDEGPDALRPTSIILVSDGAPTAGTRDIAKIVNDIASVTRRNFSIFTVNPGARGGNDYLLDLLAYRSRGVFRRATSHHTAARELLGLLRANRDPLLIGLRARYGSTFRAAEVYPETLPNLYAGRPVVIYGRCRPGDEIAVRIAGVSGKGPRKFLYTNRLPKVLVKDATIAREWARGKIHHLTAKVVQEGDNPADRAEIQRLSRQYKLESPYN
jgi:Ca-activated chloride channel family protein